MRKKTPIPLPEPPTLVCLSLRVLPSILERTDRIRTNLRTALPAQIQNDGGHLYSRAAILRLALQHGLMALESLPYPSTAPKTRKP